MMTREEAIEILQEEHDWVQEPCYVINAIKKAIEALRPVSRELVERMAGEWVQNINKGTAVFYCSFCGESFEIRSYEFQKYRFCPFCMSPMTDEAEDMVMKRLEALKDGKDI